MKSRVFLADMRQTAECQTCGLCLTVARLLTRCDDMNMTLINLQFAALPAISDGWCTCVFCCLFSSRPVAGLRRCDLHANDDAGHQGESGAAAGWHRRACW